MTTARPAPVRGQAATGPASRRPAGRAATWCAVAVLVLSTGAFFTVFGDAQDGESRPLVLAIWLLVYAVAGCALLDALLRERRPLPVAPALIVFIGLAAASVTWSVAPEITVRRTVGLVGTVLVGTVLAQRLSPAELLEALRRAMLLIVLISLALYLLDDPRVIDDVHGTLRGVVATKNTMGRTAAIGLLAAAATAFLDRSALRRSAGSAVPMAIALALTDSAGGALTALLALGAFGLAWLRRDHDGRRFLGGVVTLTLGLSLVLVPGTTPQDAASLVGRDASLTGRTDLWALSMEAALDRPLLGHGYGAFWHPGRLEGAPAADRISDQLNYPVAHAHNGLIDAALTLGVVGAVLMVLLLTALLARGVGSARRGLLHTALFQLAIGSLIVVSNVAESSFLRENALLTLLLVAALSYGRAGAADASPYGITGRR